MSTTKRKIIDIASGSPQHFLATIANLDVLARDEKGAVKVVGPNISVNPHGVGNLSNVELSATINPLDLRLGDEVLVTKVHDRYIVHAIMPISQRTGAPGVSYGLGARDTGGTPQPTNVTARISGKWLKIEWDAVPRAAYYQVIRSANQSTTDITSEILAETSATTYDTRYRGEDADPTMWYSVVAVDKNSRASYMSDWIQPTVEGSAEGGFYSASLTSSVSGELIISNSSGTLRTQFRTHNSPTPFIVEINDPAAGHSDTQPIANNSILYMADKNGNKVYVKVSSAINKGSYWAYKCTKISPASGTNRTIAAGTTVINYGVSGKGYIYQTADNANGPFISIRTHTADGGSYPIATAPLELVRMGNLNGNWGYVTDIFGFAVGQYAANQPNITIDTTNGLRIRNYTTAVLTLDTSGNASFSGSITATSGAIGGFSIGEDYVRDLANSFGLASTVTGGDDVRFWAGATFANRASAPFRATEAGAVTATNITITGGAIDGAVINNLSITAGKIGNLEITAAQIANSTITGAKIDSGTITGGNIASGTITAGNMADLTITAGKIANLTITASQVNNYTLKLGNLTQEVVNALSQMDARNQLYNGGFEDGSTFWNSGTVQTNSSNAHSGNKYLEMTSSGSSSVQVDETGATRYFQIIASQTIRFSAWAYRASGDRNIWCVVETFDKDYAHIDYHISPNVSASTTWTLTSIEFVAESNAKYAKVYLEIQNGTTTTTARFDDVTLFILVPGGDIVARTITADRIVAGSITANEIAVNTITASQLSATAIDSMTITGATIRTASSGARTEMNASNLFGLGFGGIGGYDGSTVQWYAKNSDGKLYAGGGKVVADSTGFYATDGTNRVFTVASTAYTLNGESLSVGDIILGNNATATANLKIASGALVTRTDTTKYIHLSGRQLYTENDAGFSTEVLTVTGATGTNQDLDANGFGSGAATFYTNFVRVTSTGNWTLRSIVTGVDGQWLFLINESANNMTIANAGSAPAGYSAIRTFDGSSPATTNAGCALFVFNATNGTWDLMSHRG